MRKIVFGGMTAALALSLTACNINANDNPAAAGPSSPANSAPAPSGTATPSGNATPGDTSTPGNGSNPGDSGGSSTPRSRPTPPTQQGGQQISSKWGPLHYLAPGKYAVGHVVFFTSTDTRLTIAGGDCPDGTPPPADSFKCGIDGLDDWAQASNHDVNVRFSGQTATSIQETQ
jgi:hypothetical protein